MSKLKTAAAVAEVRIAQRGQAIHQALQGADAALEVLRRQIAQLEQVNALPELHGTAGAAAAGTATQAPGSPAKGAAKPRKASAKVTACQAAQRPAMGLGAAFDAALHELQAAAAAIATSLEPLRPFAQAYTVPLPALENNPKEENDGTPSLF
jgi:hypothetical protein